MEVRGGGCCIARYAGGSDVASRVGRIMLRFRPIAPKPANGESVTGGTNNVCVRSSRTKRRYAVREEKKRCKKQQKAEEKHGDSVVTLPLLPESPNGKDSPPSDLTVGVVGSDPGFVQVLTPRPVRPVGSCVIVEQVSDTCLDGEGVGLGCTDEEKKRSLEGDTCPGFISDALNSVTWTNEAYRKFGEMVRLVVKEKLPETLPMFGCRVKVLYTCRKDRGSLTAPCDVWRLEDGGLAWRLDVNAALSLGR